MVDKKLHKLHKIVIDLNPSNLYEKILQLVNAVQKLYKGERGIYKKELVRKVLYEALTIGGLDVQEIDAITTVLDNYLDLIIEISVFCGKHKKLLSSFKRCDCLGTSCL